MKKMSDKRKRQEGRGTGTEKDYKPYIQAREVNSMGTCSNPIDWKTGRTVQLLSQGEDALWHILRWNDDVVDIREQYPLDLKRTFKIAGEYGIQHPGMNPMTTDFLVTMRSGLMIAYSLKPSKDVLEDKRIVEKLFMEKTYWVTQGVEFKLIFKTDINMILYNNIRLVVQYYRAEKVHDDASVIKHLIATKMIPVDMESTPLKIRFLKQEYEKEIALWRQQNSRLATF